MSAAAGAELASAVRHQSSERGALLMLLTAAAINALKNTGLGFLAGVSHYRPEVDSNEKYQDEPLDMSQALPKPCRP